MKKEIANAWVKELRTTDKQQAKKVLYNGKGYCCLGILCEMLGRKFEKQGESGTYVTEDDEWQVLPCRVCEETGIQSDNGRFVDVNTKYKVSALSSLNDSGKTFAEIADVIEQNWERL